MYQIEPNALALCWFALLWSICCLGFFQLAGMYPLGNRTEGRSATSPAFVLGGTLLWAILLIGTCAFAFLELRWTSSVIVAGILFLFLPELFQSIPERWRESSAGLTATGLVLVLALALLMKVGTDPIKSLL
jgi:hypothetical protein